MAGAYSSGIRVLLFGLESISTNVFEAKVHQSTAASMVAVAF